MVRSPLALLTRSSPLAWPTCTSPEAELMLASPAAWSRKTSPLAVLSTTGPLADAAVMSPLAVSRVSAPNSPTQEMSAEAVRASHSDPAGALIVRSRPLRPRNPVIRGPVTTSLPSSKLTRTSDSKSSALLLLGSTWTVITSVGSPETATLPEGQEEMLIEAGSEHGNSQLVMAVPFGERVDVVRQGGSGLAAGEPRVALSNAWPGPWLRSAAGWRLKRPVDGSVHPGVDRDSAGGCRGFDLGLGAF